MHTLALLDELQIIARNGLLDATDPYDRERYERLLHLVNEYYGSVFQLTPSEIRHRLAVELGHITPKVGVDAAIFDNAGHILLGLRADDACWCLPCGWIEPNETPADGAIRETREETGLDVRVVQLVDVITTRAGEYHRPYTTIAIIYLCDVIGGTLQPSSELLDLRYWPIDNVPAWHAGNAAPLAAYNVWLNRQS